MSHYHFALALIAYQYALLLASLGKGELNHLLGSLLFMTVSAATKTGLKIEAEIDTTVFIQKAFE